MRSTQYCNLCHISSLKSIWRVYGSTSSRPRHDSTRGFSFRLWPVIRFWVLSRCDSQLTSIVFNLTRHSFYNIRTWSTCGWDHSSWHWLTACGDPNLCIVRYSWQISCTMSQIKVLLLFWSLFLVQLSEGFQINPLWYEHLVCQSDWGSKPSFHAQFHWTKITPRQRSCSVTQ